MKTFTKDEIAKLIDTNDQAVYRGLVTIYQRQTADEQNAEDTKHQNGMGFNGRDAKFGTSLAKQVIAFNEGKSTYRYPLSRTQLESGRKLLRKYAGQLAKVANEKAQAAEAAHDEARAAEAEARAEWEADQAAERHYETRAELAYMQAGYRD
jgi:hypothetical protein